MIKKLIAMTAILSSQAAWAQQRPCIDREQAADMIVVLLPYFIEGASKKCAPYLPADAFLPVGGKQLSERLRSEATGRITSALTAFSQMAGQEMPEGIDKEFTAVMGTLVSSEFVNGLDEQACKNTDELLAAIAPLPAENIGRFGAAFFAIARVGQDEGDASPPICDV